MIKSKFKYFQFLGQYWMTGLLLLLLFCFYVVFFGKGRLPILSGSGILWRLITVVFPIFIMGQMKLNYKTVIIDTDAKTISFTFFLIRITKTYPMDYFDGYIDTKVRDKYNTYKCFYLVKDGKLKYKMSGKFYNNIDELQNGLSSLKHMGHIKYSAALSLKIAFNKSIL